MTRRVPSWTLAAVVLASCGTFGTEELEDIDQPHNGVGPFRPAGREETGVSGSPPGRALSVRQAVATPMVSEGHLFYVAANPLADVVPPEEPTDGIDWSLFEPRRIFRSEPGERLGFSFGEPVLEAEESWEGDGVLDPWVVPLPDGRSRLYYAADGGIGVAEAPSVSGAFTRIGDGPILSAEGSEVLRRPSVIEREGAWLMYFDTGAGIALAESADGVSFTRMPGVLPLGRGQLRDVPDEVRVGGPAAVVAETPSGRRIVRLYLESHREDGTSAISLAASLDGRTFERLERPVVEADDAAEPGPVIVDRRVSLLYHTVPRVQSDLEMRALVVGIAPRTFQFVFEE